MKLYERNIEEYTRYGDVTYGYDFSTFVDFNTNMKEIKYFLFDMDLI